MKNLLFLVAVFCFSTGCAGNRPRPIKHRSGEFNVSFISNPVGAVIEQDGQYLGVTPINSMAIQTMCPPFVNACRRVTFTATYNGKVITKSVRFMKRQWDTSVYFNFN